MKILENFDTDVNFWDANPTFKVAGVFKRVYEQDKSKDKSKSSKLMWTIALIWDMGSRFYDLPEIGPDNKVELLFNDYYGDPKFLNKNKELVEELKSQYIETAYTDAERHLKGIMDKLRERDSFMRDTEYTLGKPTDKGWQWGTVDILDRMMANTKKLYDQWEEVRKMVQNDNDKARAHGGGEESLSDSGEI